MIEYKLIGLSTIIIPCQILGIETVSYEQYTTTTPI